MNMKRNAIACIALAAATFTSAAQESALSDYELQKLYDECSKSWDIDKTTELFNASRGTAIESQVDTLFHDVYTADGTIETITDFYKKYKMPTVAKMKAKDMKLAKQWLKLKDKDFAEFIKNAAPNDKAFFLVQYIIGGKIESRNWAEAAATAKRYLPYFEKHPKKMNALLATLEAKENTKIVPVPVSGINTNDDEYAPVISADGNFIYFCRRDKGRSRTGKPAEDIFYSTKGKSMWNKGIKVEELSSLSSNEAVEAISTDGTSLIFFKNGKLMSAVKTDKGWKTEKLASAINQGVWQADVSLSSDGNVIMFASKYKDNYHSGAVYSDTDPEGRFNTDIYVSIKDENGDWGKPVNLGSVINTKYCERSPFLHPDMKTLYFASAGHGGLGEEDIFMSKRLSDSSWTQWSEPVNIGKEINTPKSDKDYKVSTDGKFAYFSKFTENNHADIYSIELPVKYRPNNVATIAGKIRDKNGKPRAVTIKWEDMETGKTIGTAKSDPVDGSFYIVLPLGKRYGYYVASDDIYPTANSLDLREISDAKRVEENITVTSIEDMLKGGKAVVLNNIFFDFGKYDLLPESRPELERVAKIRMSNTEKVEISGHTDSIGSDKYNKNLSQKRADAVKEFLVKEGCPADRLVTHGYGSERPIESNSTDEGRAKNRRVEMKFLKNE